MAEKPDSRFVRAAGITFHTLEWSRGGKTPLVFLHGLASSSRMFDLVAPAFSADYDVIALDLRGHGLSEQPASGYDFETISGDVDGACAALGLGSSSLILVGHSWGAYVALHYAATRTSRVQALVLLDGGIARIRDRYPTWEQAETGMAPPVYEGKSLADIRAMIRNDWLGQIFRPELEPLALSIFDASDPGNVRARLSRKNHLQIAFHLWEFDPARYYPLVTCPVLIVRAVAGDDAGEGDPYVAEAQRAIADVETVTMADTSHDIPWHRPRELVEIIRAFLRRQR